MESKHCSPCSLKDIRNIPIWQRPAGQYPRELDLRQDYSENTIDEKYEKRGSLKENPSCKKDKKDSWSNARQCPEKAQHIYIQKAIHHHQNSTTTGFESPQVWILTVLTSRLLFKDSIRISFHKPLSDIAFKNNQNVIICPLRVDQTSSLNINPTPDTIKFLLICRHLEMSRLYMLTI